MTQEQQLPHKLTLSQRSALTVTGVTEVVRFEEDAAVLETAMGTLLVHGRQLQLKTLSADGGQVTVEGQVTALIYEQQKRNGGWLQRLLGG